MFLLKQSALNPQKYIVYLEWFIFKQLLFIQGYILYAKYILWETKKQQCPYDITNHKLALK